MNAADSPLKIMLIDDHAMLLRGMELLFDTIDGIDIVSTTTRGLPHRSRRVGVPSQGRFA